MSCGLTETTSSIKLQRIAIVDDYAETECRTFRHDGVANLISKKPGPIEPHGHSTPPDPSTC